MDSSPFSILHHNIKPARNKGGSGFDWLAVPDFEWSDRDP